uniref:Reverse transcriptase Ty1/copia-type domain-containing protein n=1 Tax=Chenopodium quinoa TaxID=63459 RepID=A0A803MD34_CHEQI
MKDLEKLRYFLGLEIDQSNSGIFISQRKYALDVISEFGLTKARPLKVPMDTHIKLTDPLPSAEIYQRLVGKVQNGAIKPAYIPSSEQLADILTKILPVQQHQYLLDKLGVTSHPHQA